jgi:hypothetical protein
VVNDADGGSAGSSATGGAAGSGDTGGHAGNRETGGISGTGGAVSTGGTSGTGGIPGTGGLSSTGGVTGTGGVPSTGGISGTGGVPGTGGVASTGGISGTGGVANTGGGSGGSPPTKSRDGERCSLPSDCASGTCTPFYVDLDADGYGAGQALGFCGTTAPVGYAAQSGDCCDTATNLAVAKLIHPGADFQSTSAGGVCNITWDYDCSGTVESTPQTVASCTPYPACTTVVGNYPESSCGGATENSYSCTGAGGSCFTVCGGHQAVPIRCR